MKNPSNNPDDIKRMQQEAICRARDMQSRAKPNSQQNKECEPPHHEKEPQRKENKPVRQEEHRNTTNPIEIISQNTPIHGILDVLMKDSEKSLILAIILLLVEENADISIILALMYLII